MNESEAESLNSYEIQLLLEGIEDFTGLWDAEVLARKNAGDLPGPSSRDRARRSLTRLVESGLIVVYACRGMPFEETCVRVGMEEVSQLLDIDASWKVPDEGEVGIWYDTTDDGFDVYRDAIDWW